MYMQVSIIHAQDARRTHCALELCVPGKCHVKIDQHPEVVYSTGAVYLGEYCCQGT